MNYTFYYGLMVKPIHKDLWRNNFKEEKFHGKILFKLREFLLQDLKS